MSSECEVILGVAIRVTCNGTVVVQKLPKPFRHHHLHRVFKNKMHEDGIVDEGFYTDKRHFIDREEAMDVAKKTLPDLISKSSQLFSEDLWGSKLIDLDFTDAQYMKSFSHTGVNPFIHFEKLS